MSTSEFAREVNAKGYTIRDIHEIVNGRIHCCIDELRAATSDRGAATKKQKRIREIARSILDELPVKPGTEDRFMRLCRERGVTVSAVWEYYNATRPRKYSIGAFSKSVAMPSFPAERRLRDEALKCLDEMTNSKQVLTTAEEES